MKSSISLREQLQAKLEAVGKGALSAEDRAAIADAAFAQEEEDVIALEATLRKTREIHFKKKQVRIVRIHRLLVRNVATHVYHEIY